MKSIILVLTLLLTLPAAAMADLELPVENGVVTSGVGWRVDPFGTGQVTFHRGIDIAVPVGTPVRATRKGKVVFAGNRGGYGSTVIIEHADGDRTLYGHNSLVRVQVGELVETGTVVALSGSTGRSTGPHVHFEKLPSGRPVIETAASKETTVPQVAVNTVATNSRQRQLLEQKMDESLSSVLKSIKAFGPVGQDG